MINKYFKLIGTLGLSALLFGGCAGTNIAGYFNDTNASAFGADKLIENEHFQEINLVRLLNSDVGEQDVGEKDVGEKDEYTSKELEDAFDKFYSDTPENKKKLNRNRIQERILAASQERCEEYVQFIDKQDANTNLWLGSLTTLTGGLGAIFTPVSTVRALSGTAAILNGGRAEFNETYFASKTIEVIRGGIESRRNELYTTIKTNQEKEISNYTVEAAIKDAVQFHGACSLSAGLEKITEALERVDNPGLKGAQHTLELSQKLAETMDNNGRLLISPLEGSIDVGTSKDVKTKMGGDLEKTAESKNPNIATVVIGPTLRTATITGVSPGTTSITFKSERGRTYILPVNVKNPIVLDKVAVDIQVTKSTKVQLVDGTPIKSSMSADKDIAKASTVAGASVITGDKAGTTVVTVENSDGKKGGILVTVK